MEAVERGQRFVFAGGGGFAAKWFERGRLFVLTGGGAGWKASSSTTRRGPGGGV